LLDVDVALPEVVGITFSSMAAILNTTTERIEGESKDAEEDDGDDHRDYPGNILPRTSDGES